MVCNNQKCKCKNCTNDKCTCEHNDNRVCKSKSDCCCND